MTIEESNKLIAKFMGGIYSPSELFIHSWDIPNMDGYQHVLFYDSSWDWLMPVIDKIESLYETSDSKPRFNINSHNCTFSMSNPYKLWIAGCAKWSPEIIKANSKIEAAYMLVVDFIKWHNIQTK